MKKIVLSALAVFAVISLMAQESLLNKGDKVLNLGIGLGSTLYSGTYYTTKIPPISASLEVGIIDNLFDVDGLNLGVGGYLGFTSSKYEYTFFGSSWGWEYTSVIVGARGNLHYPLVDKLDTYAGLLLGYNVVTSKSFGTGATGSAASSGLASSGFVGGRYYFTDNIAAMLELGYGIAYLNLGIGIKF